MQETIDIEDIQIPVIDIKDIQLKEYNGIGIRLYVWNDMVRCDMNGKRYYVSLDYLKALVFGRVKFCYLSDKWYSDEERKAYNEKKEIEFKERVKISLRR